ncbi:pyrimidine-specific ribonucleoside hydrolase [Angomonas deanei]|nr:pyrimidine-specific ribonucleoside hydrolase [Angomonas deanei]EPY38675.1 pyrimidine-specific ribonucleoside hydrolase [Angomonas deanei]|eukprot:EPY38132.1 pyrimidine-specific ribonucleoside hydrolase [Angomonas deanei]
MEQFKDYYQSWNELPQPRKMNIMKVITFFLYAMFLLFVVIYGFGISVGKGAREVPKTVVFMEAMPYNLQALRYLCKRRDITIGMIVLTVNSWNVNLDAAYDNIASFLQLLKKEKFSTTIPVYYGNSFAYSDQKSVESYTVSSKESTCSYRRYLNPTVRLTADRLFGGSDVLDTVSLTDYPRRYEFYESKLESYLGGNQASFLVLGPATDAAAFLQNHANLRSKVRSIVLTGGAFKVKGDAQYVYSGNTAAEINFFFDPVAANYITEGSHGRPVTVIPVDAVKVWDSGLYSTLISSVDTSAVTSAAVVSLAVQGYESALEKEGLHEKRMSVELIGAVYAADVYAQNGAQVTDIPVRVVTDTSVVKDGISHRPTSGSFNVRVILALDSSMVQRSLKM